MDSIDRKLLTIIQQDFPVSPRPYQVLAEKVGITEIEAQKRVQDFRKNNLLRRIGGIFDSKKLGYISTLCAVSVPDSQINTAARLINALPGVTHHYVRKHEYNLWFTLISPSQENQYKTLANLENQLLQKANSGNIVNLPASRVFKIKVQFDATDN